MSHWALANIPDDSETAPVRRWFNHGEHMLALLEQHQPKVTVEVGSWKGGAATAMARVVRQWGGVIYCIDTWTGDVTGGPVLGHPGMILRTADNLVSAGVSPSIRLIPALSLDAAKAWYGPIDCLFIDADHTYASVRDDLAAWWPHLPIGGVIAGDDYLSQWYPGVTRAWDEFEQWHGQAFDRVETLNSNPPGMTFISGVKR
jgi:predicted O-methyltransferase YrrM